MDVIDQTTPVIMKRYLSTLSVNQRVSKTTFPTLSANSLSPSLRQNYEGQTRH